MLLQILVHLQCAFAASRTGVLSRRWRGLWAQFPGLTLRNIPAGRVKAALARVPRHTAVSLLDIRLARSVLKASRLRDDARAKSLLRTAKRLSPEELIFILQRGTMFKSGPPVDIVMRLASAAPPPSSWTQRLSISGNIIDINAFLNHCPRLRVLRVTFREVELGSLQAALATLDAAVALGLTVSLLGIECDQINNRRHSGNGVRFASLMRAAAWLSPQELIFTNSSFESINVDLPYFHQATSIEMKFHTFRFTQLPARELSALLCLTGLCMSLVCQLFKTIRFAS
ncbi:hypothetical protein VPH35_114569 [Triticum aestivum]